METTKESGWECTHCQKIFKHRSVYANHLVIHDPNSQVQCNICKKILKNRFTLYQHGQLVHGNRPRLPCVICHLTCYDGSHLRRHMRNVHHTSERERFPCTFSGCEKTFLNKGSVAVHCQTHHTENPTRFYCALCPKHFKAKAILHLHIASHTTEKTYKCTICGRSFAINGDLKRHQLVHQEKSQRLRLTCHICPETFLSRHGLSNHIKVVHENQKTYSCIFCDKKFTTATNLKFHVEAKHPSRDAPLHSCDKCEYKSCSRIYLRRHLTRHKDKRYECYFCRKMFFGFGDLVRHYRIHTVER